MTKRKFIWLVSQPEPDWDEYDAFVVVAATERRAAEIIEAQIRGEGPEAVRIATGWRNPNAPKRIGVADAGQEEGVVLASFNAG